MLPLVTHQRAGINPESTKGRKDTQLQEGHNSHLYVNVEQPGIVGRPRHLDDLPDLVGQHQQAGHNGVANKGEEHSLDWRCEGLQRSKEECDGHTEKVCCRVSR